LAHEAGSFMLLVHRMRAASVADDWGERLGWTSDLASDEPARRRLARHRPAETRKRWTAALRSYNEVWNKRDHPEYRLRLDAYNRAFDSTYPQALWHGRTVPLAQYRCEDVGYARVARSIDSPRLRDSLAAAARSADATSRLHSAYLLWLIENPLRTAAKDPPVEHLAAPPNPVSVRR
jgi:hypothetical protein